MRAARGARCSLTLACYLVWHERLRQRQAWRGIGKHGRLGGPWSHKPACAWDGEGPDGGLEDCSRLGEFGSGLAGWGCQGYLVV